MNATNTMQGPAGPFAPVIPPVNASGLSSLTEAKKLEPLLIAAAQAQYDNWDESDIDTFAGGGICHLIAGALSEVLSNEDLDCHTVSCQYEQHVYVVCALAEGVYKLDIPYSIYEFGAGYSWTKRQGVTFEAADLIWYQLSNDATDIEDFVD